MIEGTKRECELLGIATYHDGSFYLEIELPYEIKAKEETTKFIRLFFSKESKVLLEGLFDD